MQIYQYPLMMHFYYLILLKMEVEFCFYSRIDNGSNEIKYQFHRKMIGKILRPIINKLFSIHHYDTQCGCKIFQKS